MTETKDADGDTVVVAIHFSKQKGKNVVNDIASVYGKDKNEFFLRETREGRLRYIDNKKSREWSQSSGLYLPTESNYSTASVKKVLSLEDVVNSTVA